MNNKIKKRLKLTVLALTAAFIAVCGFVVYANLKIERETRAYNFEDTDSIPAGSAVLVLGTAPTLRGGAPNPYFTYRIRAAGELYESGKAKAFVVSGDNSRKSYNEPEAMRRALIAAGVPDSIIYLDYAGFRTLDSVVRMNRIFGQEAFVVVSQRFHNERAIYLARHYGLEAYGYNARDLGVNRFSAKTKLREKLARVKVFVDLALRKQPKFLGDPVDLGAPAP